MQDKIISIGFFIIIMSVGLLSIIMKDIDISFLERRKLTTVTTLQKDYLENMDDYLIDQFPFRNNLLAINTFYERDILGNSEKNNVYVIDNYLIDKNYPLNNNKVDSFVSKINQLINNNFKNNKVFYTIIPDKGYFLNNSNDYLKIDYSLLLDKVKNIDANYFDLISKLDLSDYYYTDIHIKQDSWLNLLPIFSNGLEFNYSEYKYQENSYYPFYGASYSKAMGSSPDELVYLTNDILENVSVKHLEYNYNSVYNREKLGSIDSYDVFLGGASSLIEIENSNSSSDKELIIFRDSFASSLTPLLVPYYEKITLVDLRYIDFKYLNNYIDINDQDILFMYSTLIINNSNILKIN